MACELEELKLDLALEKKTVSVPMVISHTESAQPRIGAVLMHGAGGDMASGELPAVAAALAAAGLPCVRFTARGNMAYRVSVCKALLDQLPARCERCAGVKWWLLCGRSMGARVAIQVAHERPDAALACILLAYPLHPPNKPQQLRDEPLVQLRLPMLMVRGTRDEFSREREWEAVLRRMQSRRLEVHTVVGGGHSLRVKGAAGSQAAVEAVCQAVQRFAADIAQSALGEDGPAGSQQEGAGTEARRAAPADQRVTQAASHKVTKRGAVKGGEGRASKKKRG